MPSISSTYTQTFSYTTASGGYTGTQYFQLTVGSPPANSVFVIKYLSIASTTGWVGGSGASVTAVTSDDNVGTNAHPFVSEDWGSSPTGLTVFTALDANQSTFAATGDPFANTATQIHLLQPYIGVDVQMNVGGGTFYVTVVYVLIPGGSLLTANFNYEEGLGLTTGSGVNSPLTSSTTNSIYLKSIIFLNQYNPSDSYTIQMVALSTSGAVIEGYLGNAFTVAPYDMACWDAPFYIGLNGSTVQGFIVTSGIGVAINFYQSYCLTPG